MTLYDAYQDYKEQRELLEEDFRVKMREAGTPSPQLLMEMSQNFKESREISGFITYTHKHPLTIQKLLSFMSTTNQQKWSCRAKLSPKTPEHIEHDLRSASKYNHPGFTQLCRELLQEMQNQTFFEIIFYTTMKDKDTQTETNFAFPFVLSTTTPYEKLKTRRELLNNINFYECVFDGMFQNQDTVWTICPQKEANQFLPNVVKEYMKTVKFIEKEHTDKQL
ncbi:MAG: hypothetical protein J6J24_03560 [Clostridia bacterium]|nr:hypothetical protein [Clostridia bacterium]